MWMEQTSLWLQIRRPYGTSCDTVAIAYLPNWMQLTLSGESNCPLLVIENCSWQLSAKCCHGNQSAVGDDDVTFLDMVIADGSGL